MSCEEDMMIDDEENFYNIFSDLIYYIETKCCNLDEQSNFKLIIDDLILISNKRKLDKIDVNYILFKDSISKSINKFRCKKITENVLKEQVFKFFEIGDCNYLLKQLVDRYGVRLE